MKRIGISASLLLLLVTCSLIVTANVAVRHLERPIKDTTYFYEDIRIELSEATLRAPIAGR
jgi:hypothetical protein